MRRTCKREERERERERAKRDWCTSCEELERTGGYMRLVDCLPKMSVDEGTTVDDALLRSL